MSPPRWARVVAGLLVRGPESEFILGDLREMYARWGGGARATLRYLGWAVRSAVHESRVSTWAGVRADVRVALRQFRRHPRVYLGSALVLTVGLGISTLAWGVHYGTFGRDLPVSHPDRVLSLDVVDRNTHAPSELSVEDGETIRASVASLDAVALWASTWANLSDGAGPPEQVLTDYASADLFRVLEIRPLHGRTLLPSDEAPGSPRVAVLGYRYWRERYGGDPSVVGRSVRLDGHPTLVVGVLAPDEGLTGHETFWRSVGSEGDRGARDYYAIARLRPGASAASLARELEALAAGLAESGQPAWRDRGLEATTFNESFYGGVESTRDRVLSLGGLLLFIMALANVANLFLVHARVRSGELAVRRALGASRLRILRHLSLEAAIPAVMGFVGAMAVAAWTLSWYQDAADAYGVGFVWQVYRLEAPHVVLIGAGALASTLFVSVVAGTRAWLGDGGASLRQARGGVSSGFRLSGVLLGVEVAVGAALFLVASLMIRSAWNLRTVDYGFATGNVMTGKLTLRGLDYADPAPRLAFWTKLQDDLTRVDGVEAATVGTQLPMIRCCGNSFRVELEGWDVPDPARLPVHYVDAVTSTYFDTFGKRIPRGRGITTGDGPDSEPVAVVNVPFADRYFPDDVPVGRRLRLWRGDAPGPWRTIVGVAPDLWMDTDENARPEGMYVPLAQFAPAAASVAIRVAGRPETYADALRSTVMRLDPDLPVSDVRSMPQLIHDRTSLYRREGPLFALLGLSALVLALVGLYTVVSYLASLRTAELALRSALGASRRGLIGRSVVGAVLPTLVGTVVGLAVGLSLTRGFDRFVFLVDPWSPWVAAATLLVMLVSACGASLPPVLRASRVDPAEVLRSE